MKLLLLFGLAAAALAQNQLAAIMKHNAAYEIGKVHWKAGVNEHVQTLDELKRLCKTLPGGPELPPASENAIRNDIPDAFDSRQEWSACADVIGHIYDQGHCGSCWAMGAFETLEDRICIQTNGSKKIWLGPQDLVSCDTTSMGCNGGWPSAAWQTLKNTGIVTEACYPYAMGTCKHPGCSDWPTPACNKTCANEAKFFDDKHFAASAYSVSAKEAAIQTEIMNHGPVEAAFTVYEDFANYKSGVYHHVSGSSAGGHAIKIIGWGVDAGVKYWTVVNSWNTDWGMNGLFWIQRGVNECGIEGQAVAGLARV